MGWPYSIDPQGLDQSERAERAHEAAETAFLEAVERNVDRTLLVFDSPAARQYPVSEWLGDCGPEARKLLFAACHLAAKDMDLAAADMLRKFYALVAKEYADDNSGAWE